MKFSILLVVLPFVESGPTLYQLWSEDSLYKSTRLGLSQDTNHNDAYWLVERDDTQDLFYLEDSELVKFPTGNDGNKLSAHVDLEKDDLLFTYPEPKDFQVTDAKPNLVQNIGGLYLSVNDQTGFESCNDGHIRLTKKTPGCIPIAILVKYDVPHKL
ncbi:hypothetical protein NEOLI_005405 [Neolecta irregularis DAH-3]|uniref:Uncharacterized protein n=1 Tax=Neolecta irregularis (strain DAH-3) TaxID=1198029 RepID=A0A1U7LHS6_NEOID|nr:hypothetical protein NEOLI_005405 [Neolecta irregularis DAH-3]|eukprot:OLL22206.1 hypothetical protein NEOLI_005405 [Neolecta irregularis DAH-3]